MDIKLLGIESRKVLDTTYTYNYSGRGYMNYGTDNLFPQHIAAIVANSASQSSIIQTKLKMVCGEEIEGDRMVNPKEKLSAILHKITLDYLTFGGFALRIVTNGDTKKIYHVDFTKVRCGTYNQYNEIENFYLKADWRITRSNSKNNNLIEIPAYGYGKNDSPDNKTLGELFYFANYSPDIDFYPKPDWYGAKDEVMMDYELSNYLAAILSNGNFPKQMFLVSDEFTPEEEIEFLNLMSMNFKGTSNAGVPIVVTGLKKEQTLDIKDLDYKIIDPNFKIAVEVVTNKIVEANRIPRVIAGLEAGAGFSNSAEELRTAFEIFNNMVIKTYQKNIKDALEPIIKDFNFKLTDVLSAQISEDTLVKIMTIDELRDKFGYDKLNKA